MNYKLPSYSSVLNTLTIPLGNGIPNLLFFEFKNFILFEAFKLF